MPKFNWTTESNIYLLCRTLIQNDITLKLDKWYPLWRNGSFSLISSNHFSLIHIIFEYGWVLFGSQLPTISGSCCWRLMPRRQSQGQRQNQNRRQQRATGVATTAHTRAASHWEKGKVPASCIYAPIAPVKWKVRAAPRYTHSGSNVK